MWVEGFFSLLVVVVSASLAWVFRRKRKQGFFRRYGIPGPEPELFWGNFMQLKKDRLQVMERWINEYGKVFGYYRGVEPYMVVADPEMVKQCLIKEFSTFQDRPPLVLHVEPFASSLLDLRGSEWKRVRSVLNPTFSSAKMKQMATIVRNCLGTMMEVLEETYKADEPVDMRKVAQGFTLDVITKCAFAWQVDCQKNPNDPLLKGVRTVFQEFENPALRNVIRFPALRPIITAVYWLSNHQKVLRRMADNLRQVIALRRQDQKPVVTDMLQLMLEAQAGGEEAHPESFRRGERLIEDRHVVANSFIFLAAGVETTAIALGFLTYLLATHPDEQERLYAEIEAAFGEDELSYEGVQSLKRLDMVVQEALRIYPPVVMMVRRRCQKDTTIMGQFFPAGVDIIVPLWHLHHDPALWEDPFEFRPERFDSQENGGVPDQPAAFMPFGLGPRVCIGSRLALLVIKMAVCRILREYRLLRGENSQEPLKLTVPSASIIPERRLLVKLGRRRVKGREKTVSPATTLSGKTASA